MSLPRAVGSHHTVWVGRPGAAPHPLRYAVEGDRLVCFADGTLADLHDGDRVNAAVHEIAGGPALATFTATVHDLAPDSIDDNSLAELLAHVSLGRSLSEVEASLAGYRARRRVVALEP